MVAGADDVQGRRGFGARAKEPTSGMHGEGGGGAGCLRVDGVQQQREIEHDA